MSSCICFESLDHDMSVAMLSNLLLYLVSVKVKGTNTLGETWLFGDLWWPYHWPRLKIFDGMPMSTFQERSNDVQELDLAILGAELWAKSPDIGLEMTSLHVNPKWP